VENEIEEVMNKLNDEKEYEKVWELATETNKRGKHRTIYEELEKTGKTKFFTKNYNQIAGLKYRLRAKYPSVQIKVAKASIIDPKLDGWVMLAKL
jgi:5-hydroxyisourate hydrolase-like protein (transthyretin family)